MDNFIKTVFLGGGIKRHDFEVNDLNSNPFNRIISLENLFLAWQEFKKGKSNKINVQQFGYNLENNLVCLHEELETKSYKHSNYTAFSVCDPKLRRIHKAIVKDRILHHAIFRVLYPIFDKSFIFDSYSCRTGKGSHRAIRRLEDFLHKSSKNNCKNIFALKCDIKKFFDSIDQEILLELIKKKIKDENSVWLIEKIIRSFLVGIPLGNVTSQLFANVYLNELDQFVKHKLKVKHYLRYCDDFIILNEDVEYLKKLIVKIKDFLNKKLKLTLHPNKIIIRKYKQGIDFLGYIVLPHHRVLRTKTKRRILRKMTNKCRLLQEELITEEFFGQSLQSYLGILKHCEGHGTKMKIMKIIEQ